MKRSLCSSDDSLGGALISICQTTDEHSSRNNQLYGREFQAILDGLDEEGCLEETGGYVSEKKRRLSVDQVKALEKNFELENKLEPERKVKLAQELGLQPRQVAVWFQNRRARWKTKQLERDYGVLKANFDTLKLNYDTLQHDNEALLKQIRELKSKLNEEETESNVSVKEEEEMIVNNGTDPKRSHDDQESNRQAAAAPPAAGYYQEPDQELINYDNGVLPDFKDGSSDSDSSAILNEDNGNSPNSITQNQQQHQLSISCFEFSKPPLTYYQTHPFVKMEEHNFFGDETCDFFSDDDEQAPTLPWYYSHQWT